MRIRTVFGCWIGLAFLLAAAGSAPAAQGGSEDYAWLNGKWSGIIRDGGNLEMNLKVVSGNHIEGSGSVPGRGGRHQGTRYTLTGTVVEKKVLLELDNDNPTARGTGTVRLQLELTDGKLTGTQGKDNQVSFSKVQ